MGLFLKVSNSIQSLAKQLAVDSYTNQNDVFSTLYIATQTKGMNNWLKLELAANLGIIANYKFIKPNDVVSQIYYLFGGERKQMLNTENLKWILYSVLNEDDFKLNFPTVADYYIDNDEKRIGLAAKLADLFDQYQVYRTEYPILWEMDILLDENEFEEKWQAALWKKVHEKLSDEFLLRVNVEMFIEDALKIEENHVLLKEKFSQINLFGLSIFTQSHLVFYKGLSNYIDVNFYMLDPAYKHQWFEKDTEALIKKRYSLSVRAKSKGENNILLNNWGKLIQNTFQLFLNEVVTIEYLHLDGKTPKNKTLLEKIQEDISSNASKAERNSIVKKELNDGSITINACYTPVREVEVFYNYLAAFIDKSSTPFSVRSMIVMVSDINLYAPYIKAVFDNAPYKIPYTIADQSIEEISPILVALTDLMKLSNENFTSENLVQLLDNKLIQARFGITNTSLVRTAVDKAAIRFGLEGSAEKDTQFISFKNGLKRLLYGYCMVGDDSYMEGTEEYYPVELSEGHEAKDIISFFHFINVLEASLSERVGQKTLSAWVTFTADLINNLIVEDSEVESDDYKTLLYQLSCLNEAEELMNEEISYTVFSRQLLQNLQNETTTSSYLNGGITFCSFIPMRSIPFDTVAMLGLNFDKFPRKESAIQFDLIAMHPKVGDRNIKENDKHLFLETILSANKQLYLSYIGRGASDNAKLLPSSLVEELLDYISDGLAEKIDVHAELITLHPLHGFSNKYNARNQSLYSYLGDAIMPMPGQRPPQPPQQLGLKEIDLNDFINFFKNPFKHYYNRQLSIYYEDSASVLDETEVFDIDHLLKWQLQHDLILLEPNEVESYRIRAVKSGMVPLKNASKVFVESVYDDIQFTKSLYDDCRNNEQKRFENFQLPCGSAHIISGKIEELHGDKFIELSFSKSEYKYILAAFIKHLIACCTGLASESCFISKAKKNIFVFETITSSEAMDILVKLIEYYEKGQQVILPYYINFSEKPSKLIDYDEMNLVGMIKGHVDHYKFPLSDAYVLKEYYDGYFDEGANASEFLENYRTIHTFLSETIPSYTF